MNAAAGLVEVRVPDMGNFKDVAIIDILVKPGDTIEVETPLVTLETEKATMDVPSTVGGTVEKVHIAKGGTVSPGDLIATVRAQAAAGASPGADGSRAADSKSTAPEPAENPTNTAQSAAAEDTADTGANFAPGQQKDAASGAAATSAASSAASARREPASGSTGAKPTGAAASASRGATPPAGAVLGGRTDLPPINEPGFSRAHAGPSVRKFARELGVDLTRVTGGGFKGRVTHDDIKAYVKKALAPVAGGGEAKGPGAGLLAVPVVDFAAFGEVEIRKLSRIQKISGPRLHASWVNIPHVTQFDDADITALEELRGELKQKAAATGIKLTPLAFILRACVRGLQEFPQFNASLDPTGANIVLKKYVNVGFAADTPSGLVVPVVHDANRKDIYEIARLLGELSEKARAGKLSPAEMQGGCFTISSLGGIGGTAFTPIINAPEVAILGVSRAAMRPVYKDGAFVPRLILPLSLSYDHRVIDGATAARFTTFLAQMLADPHALAEAVP